VRLLLICPSWGRPCGIASYTAYLSSGLAARGVASDVATTPAAVQRYLTDNRYDGILLQHEYGLYYFNLVAFLTLADRTGLPFIITMHNSDNRGWMGAQHLFLFNTRARFVVHSEAACRNVFAAQPRLDPSRVHIVPMGSPDWTCQFGEPARVRVEMGLDAHKFAVGFFGFAARHKGIPNLVRALLTLPDIEGFIGASVHPTNPLAVDDIYRECGIPRPSRNLGRHLNVTFSHERIPDDKIGRYQNAMDVIILPYGMHEASVSTSMMAHEALAAHRPVIVTDVVYFSDLHDEVFKIPSNEPPVIAQAITRLRDDPLLRAALSERAAAYARQNNWPAVAGRYLDLLR